MRVDLPTSITARVSERERKVRVIAMPRIWILLLAALASATVGIVTVALPAGAASNVTLNATTCALNGPDVTLNGTWASGTSTCTVTGFSAVQPGSTLTIPSGTTLNDSSATFPFNDSGSVVNDGTVNACFWNAFGSGVTTNATTGTFTVAAIGSCRSAELEIYVGGAFDNHGTYNDAGSLVIDGFMGGASFTNFCGSTYNQTGPVVTAQGGILTFPSGCPQTITFTGPATGLVGGSYTASASASSGLTPQFSLDSSSTGCGLSGASVTFTAAGTCVIDADQPGNGTYASAPTVKVSTVISLVPQTITFTGPATGLVGGSYTASASASSGLTPQFSLDSSSTGCGLSGASVTFTAAGTCVIDADQPGNGTYASAPTVKVSTVISLVPQTITFTGPATGLVGGSYTASASASSGLTPQFSLDSSSTGCGLSGASVTFTAAGTCVIDADQPGNGTYASAPTVKVSTVISLVPQTITFTGPATGLVGGSYTASASASSGLTPQFSLDSSSTGCGLSGASVTFTAAGTCVIDADQPGNGTYASAPTVKVSTLISVPLPNSQTISFLPLADKVYGSAPFSISATATSGLPVSLASLTAGVCTVSGTTVTLVSTGQCTIQATQLGDGSWLAASPVNQSFSVEAVVQVYLPSRFPVEPGAPIFVAFSLVDANGRPIPNDIADAAKLVVSFDGGPPVSATYVPVLRDFLVLVPTSKTLTFGSYPLTVTSDSASVPITHSTVWIKISHHDEGRVLSNRSRHSSAAGSRKKATQVG